MDYIFNIKARFADNLGTLTTQYLTTKKSIEKNIINVKAVLDTSSLTLKSVQEQLNKQSLTINVGDIRFSNTGIESVRNEMQQVANTTQNVTQQTQQAKQAVQQLASAYQELSKQDVFDALNGGVLPKSIVAGTTDKGTLKSVSQEDRLQALAAIRKAYEDTFGNTNVEVQGISNIEGALQRFVVTAKNAKDEVLKFEYALKPIKEKGVDSNGNPIEKIIGGQFQYKGGTFGESSIKQTEKELLEQQRTIEAQNKALEKQSAHYTEINNKVGNIIAKQQERNNQIQGIDKDSNGKMFATIDSPSEDLQKYIEAFNKLNAMLSAYQTAIDKDVVVTQTFKNNLSSTIAELSRYGENIQKAQVASAGNLSDKDVTALAEAAKSDLQRFTAEVNMSGLATDDLKTKLVSLKTQLDGVADSKAYTAYTDELRKVKAEYQQIKVDATAATQAAQMLADTEKTLKQATDKNLNNNAVQSPENVKLLQAEYNKTVEAINKFKTSSSEAFVENKKAAEQAIQSFGEYIKVLQTSEQNINATDNAIKKLQSDTQKGLFAQNSGNSEVVQLQQDVKALSDQYAQLQARFQSEGATQEVIAGFTQLDNQIKSTSERAKELKQSLTSARDAAALEDRKSNLNNKIETWLRNNTRASESMRQSMKSLQTQIQSADKSTLTHLTQQFNELNRTAQQTGQIGKSALDIFKEKAAKFAGWFGLANAFMSITNEAKQALVTLKDVDSILTEISKTSERSAESLEKLGESAFDAASKYGVSVQNYLTGVQEMARAGYEVYGEERSAQLAELALLIQSAGDTTDAVARDALIATDAAYQLGGDVEKLTRIFDGFNKITNNSAISMNDMASAIKETAAIANNYGVTVEQLSALIATATAKTRQSGAETGNAIKSLLVTLSDVTNGTVVKAFDAVGVSMYKFVDGSKQLKTPIELLEELSKVFNELPQGDDRRSILLNDIGGCIYCHYVQKCA